MTRLPRVALVGRANVGKSTLFNRLVGERLALVHDEPGVTRDRLFGTARHAGRRFGVIDTGGLELDSDDPMFNAMRAQTQLAIDEADLVALVVDARAGLTPADRDVALLLRRAGKAVICVANKLDTLAQADLAAEVYALGFATVIAASAEHGRNFTGVVDALLAGLTAAGQPAPPADDDDAARGQLSVAADDPGEASRVEWAGGPICVAVVGRPNVGKSSLVNRLLGAERLLATPIAGTTRDPIDAEVERDGQAFVLVDTAGIRKKSSIADKLEHFAVVAALRSVERADVVLVVLDGTARIGQQDAKIAALAHEQGKGIIVIANKWDLIENPEWKDKFPKAVAVDLPFVDYAPVVYASAKTGRGLGRLFQHVVAAQRERHRRIGTGELNRFFERVVERCPPSAFKGKRAKLYYVTQPLVRPPTFIFTASNPSNIPTSYARFLRNSLRERYGFLGTPIWLRFRPRGRKKGIDAGSKLTD